MIRNGIEYQYNLTNLQVVVPHLKVGFVARSVESGTFCILTEGSQMDYEDNDTPETIITRIIEKHPQLSWAAGFKKTTE